MTICLNRHWRLIAFVFFFAVQTLIADEPADGEKGGIRDELTGLVFADVEGFTRDEVHHYDHKSLGYSVDYQSKLDIRISIYVYDFGFRSIPDGPFSDVIQKQIVQAREDIYRAKEQGSYQDVKDMWSGVVLLGENADSPKASKMTFKLRRNDKDYYSELLLTGFKHHFLKVRVTFPDENESECHKATKRVLDRLGLSMVAAMKGDKL